MHKKFEYLLFQFLVWCQMRNIIYLALVQIFSWFWSLLCNIWSHVFETPWQNWNVLGKRWTLSKPGLGRRLNIYYFNSLVMSFLISEAAISMPPFPFYLHALEKAMESFAVPISQGRTLLQSRVFLQCTKFPSFLIAYLLSTYSKHVLLPDQPCGTPYLHWSHLEGIRICWWVTHQPLNNTDILERTGGA